MINLLDYSHLAGYSLPILHDVMQTINALLKIVLNSYLSVKTKAHTTVITEKCFLKSPIMKKNFGLGLQCS